MRFLALLITVLSMSHGGMLRAQAAAGKSPARSFVASRTPWFSDASDDTGTAYHHEDGAYSYAMGSGAAWLDIENDGDEDLYVLSSITSGAMFRNDGGVFTDIMSTCGITPEDGNDPIGVICADYDQDGLTDIYLCNTRENNLYHNEGSSVFNDRAESIGAQGGDAWSTSASWADFDLDGDLDLYVGNYIRQLNFPYHYGEPNVLLENNGPGVPGHWFADVAESLGVDNSGLFGPSLPGYYYVSPEGEGTAGCTLSTATLDYDEDGDPDLMVGNDFGQWVLTNKLYRNEQAGAGMDFSDVTTAVGFDTRPHYNMGIVPCDYDHDGDWDFYKSNLGDNLLLRNDDGVLVDATYTAGPISGQAGGGLLLTSWSVLFEDFNNDTFEDIFVANGYIPAASFIDNKFRAPNDLWINAGDGTFYEVPGPLTGAADRGAARALARADLNSDGYIDFYLQNNGAAYVESLTDRSGLFLNTGDHGAGHWLEMDAAGRFSNREAFGARIDAEVDGVVLKRQVLCDPIFLASHSRVVHLGLGDATEVDRITIHWPSGIVQTWIDVPADQRLALLEPAVTLESVDPIQYSSGLLTLTGTFRNHDNLDQTAEITFRVLDQDDGTELFLLSSTEMLLADQSAAVILQQAVPPPAYALIQGTRVEITASVLASGSVDDERDYQTLP